MPESKARFPLGFALVLAATAAFWVAVLADALTIRAGGGEAVIAAAYEGMFLLAGLWLSLILLLIIAAAMGEMPRAGGWAACFLVPVSAIAAFVALDACSRNLRGAAIFPAALAGLIAFYAAWARIPGLRASLPEKDATRAVWGGVFILSALAFGIAALF
ncbi:hypothetical protein [Rhodoblastus sp.]|jgi:hypothetical protein|uniref:hypothetical protein n=1 Tax=Rhodoblastus sp. TaxID=1962975 RepID=UPI0025E70D18|nr:hypothetical protein [Rhodoblastus sp.]